eukprot:TRINITY_DN8210_c0_g1_i1.p1 TRINITY_DN8210_c0_g1~~TRINITY_DN8210_c0_g1_i1.p1  ORF type:complete len:370 (-),score=78.17 TRINITY_DN8210_c0_g1_i1:24-977(-)
MIVGGLALLGQKEMKLQAFYPAAEAVLHSSSEVEQRLGSPLNFGWLLKGSVRTLSSRERHLERAADVSWTVTGPKGSGAIFLKAHTIDPALIEPASPVTESPGSEHHASGGVQWVFDYLYVDLDTTPPERIIFASDMVWRTPAVVEKLVPGSSIIAPTPVVGTPDATETSKKQKDLALSDSALQFTPFQLGAVGIFVLTAAVLTSLFRRKFAQPLVYRQAQELIRNSPEAKALVGDKMKFVRDFSGKIQSKAESVGTASFSFTVRGPAANAVARVQAYSPDPQRHDWVWTSFTLTDSAVGKTLNLLPAAQKPPASRS